MVRGICIHDLQASGGHGSYRNRETWLGGTRADQHNKTNNNMNDSMELIVSAKHQ
jgi:hypothetical protein